MDAAERHLTRAEHELPALLQRDVRGAQQQIVRIAGDDAGKRLHAAGQDDHAVRDERAAGDGGRQVSRLIDPVARGTCRPIGSRHERQSALRLRTIRCTPHRLNLQRLQKSVTPDDSPLARRSQIASCLPLLFFPQGTQALRRVHCRRTRLRGRHRPQNAGRDGDGAAPRPWRSPWHSARRRRRPGG
jgi:hypothetical protein